MCSCGAVHDFSAFYKAVEDGQDPQKAWKKLAKQISDKATYGTWQGDRFAAVASDYVVNSCHIHEVRSALACTQKKTVFTPCLLHWSMLHINSSAKTSAQHHLLSYTHPHVVQFHSLQYSMALVPAVVLQSRMEFFRTSGEWLICYDFKAIICPSAWPFRRGWMLCMQKVALRVRLGRQGCAQFLQLITCIYSTAICKPIKKFSAA